MTAATTNNRHTRLTGAGTFRFSGVTQLTGALNTTLGSAESQVQLLDGCAFSSTDLFFGRNISLAGAVNVPDSAVVTVRGNTRLAVANTLSVRDCSLCISFCILSFLQSKVRQYSTSFLLLIMLFLLFCY